ncbi:uncharacterized protein LOC135278851 [Passer domesticus]|uniref:uncharacterized protein LOC135278851 n=1 Tax=Passer domesticus TaxID=48849 RepID=UPI0030FE3EFD
MGQDNCKPQPGDLIEIDRPRHQHWAIYVGDGYVINLTPVGKPGLKPGAHTMPVFIRKVKKQRLKKVVKNHKGHVNNKYDHSYPPLPVKEIIQRAESYIDRELNYPGFGSNCEYFVIELRYGEAVSEQLRAVIREEVRILGVTDNKDDPSLGDLIEIQRPAYQHWALYLGKGYVIHVTGADEAASSPSTSSGSVVLRRAKVKKELLKEVVRNDEWHVNNKYDCYRTPFPVEEIIRRAEQWIDKELPYRLFLKNCEHFVTMLRYGDGVSEQAKTALQNINSVSSAVMAGIGAVSLMAVASIPVIGLPLVAGAPFVVAGSGSLLACIGLSSSNVAHSVTFGKFEKAGRDILERSCC